MILPNVCNVSIINFQLVEWITWKQQESTIRLCKEYAELCKTAKKPHHLRVMFCYIDQQHWVASILWLFLQIQGLNSYHFVAIQPLTLNHFGLLQQSGWYDKCCNFYKRHCKSHTCIATILRSKVLNKISYFAPIFILWN